MTYQKTSHSSSSKRLLLLSKVALFFLVVFSNLFVYPHSAHAKLQSFQSDDGVKLVRSVESLRDLESQTWQMVAYRDGNLDSKSTLRVVGYPGTLRLDHPMALRVQAGLRTWFLEDITLLNEKLAKDPREAAAEFDLTPLLTDLNNNRPLRLCLTNVFTELPVPPYVVGEWRSLDNPAKS
ncbi:DUF3122 domain-containing protein [Prochlorococcus sp. MIT 1341]|uniref:DUF3122 domain-containing protein n=1 Tax=Prochlorococcus sp. MIT 1341 TaxID=3096221 RepID=UPI002A75185B|nr:DUF3122 domain-containing protein [Prochlorococcus sp. MIT 1341]